MNESVLMPSTSVELAAKALDEIKPTWFECVEPDKLFVCTNGDNLSHSNCVLDQSFAEEAGDGTNGFGYAKYHTGLDVRMFSGIGKTFWPHILFVGMIHTQAFIKTRELWTNEINKRKAQHD